MAASTRIRAIIWDYDGTLVDTRHKNLNVTRKIIEHVTGGSADNFPALKTLNGYHCANRRTSNWRQLYRREFQLTDEQIDEAGRMWTAYQLEDDTDASAYPGVGAVIRSLDRFPHGIVSQNSKRCITKNLEQTDLLSCFGYVVGYEEVDIKRQKPEPDGLLRCTHKLSKFAPGVVCYIGDHETDAECAARANRVLEADNIDVTIVSIGAFYDSGPDVSAWQARPDYEARVVEEITDIIGRL